MSEKKDTAQATVGTEPNNPKGVTPDATDNVYERTMPNRETYAPDGTRYRNRNQDPEFSALQVTEKRRSELTNAGPDRKLTWVRDPQRYNNFEDNIDRNQNLREDFQICETKDGKPFKREDLVLCSYPMEVHLDEQAFEIEKSQEWAAEMGLTNRKVPLDYSKEELRQMAQERHEQFKEMPSRTSGLSYKQALSLYTDEQIKAVEDEARRGGESESFTQEDWRALMARKGGEKPIVMGVGRGLGNENPNSALGQVRARDARNNKAKEAAGKGG